MRIAALIAFSAVALVVVPAAAQNEAPYPFETETPAAAASDTDKPATKKSETKKPAGPRLPPVRPAAIAAETEKPKEAAASPDVAKTETAKPAVSAEAVRLPLARPAAIEPAKIEQAKPEQAKTEKTEPEKKVAARSEPAKPAVEKPAGTPTAAAGDILAGIPADERLKIQSALLWAGDYGEAADGEDPAVAAIRSFRKRNKLTATGPLTAAERQMLIAATQGREDEYGWTVMVDPATGVRLGLPTKMMPHAREAPRGTRWSSGRGELLVETFRINEPDLKLAALFEREKSEPAARRVEYSVLRNDSFYIRGLQGLKKFSVRATIRDGEVRGFTLMFDQAMETIVAQVSEAMVSAFTPFPERGAPFAALARTVEYGNGLVVSAQGHIVTDRNLTEGCQVIVAAGLGDTARIADDRNAGLALLRFYGARQMPPMTLDAAAARPGEVTLTGIPDPKQHEGRRTLTEIKARLVDGSRIELRQPVPMAGFSGAAALGPDGRFLGMMKMRSVVLASTAPVLPPVRLIDAAAIRGFLSAHKVMPETGSGASGGSGDARASIVRIICVRN